MQYEIGGILLIKDNWIVYFPPYPEDQHDFHDSLIVKFKEIDQYSVSYLDQIDLPPQKLVQIL